MKKQYVFLILVGVILYILYRILTFTYQEYKMNGDIEFITQLNRDIKEKNKKALDIIDYKKSKAYRNYILKSEQSFKNKGEKVLYVTSEKTYNKFIKEPLIEPETLVEGEKHSSVVDSMTIYEKWMYFIFKKDIR